jgi:hypothetical protein
LRLRSLIAPDERRPQYLIVLIEQNGTVHLAGEAGALDFLRRTSRIGNRLANR